MEKNSFRTKVGPIFLILITGLLISCQSQRKDVIRFLDEFEVKTTSIISDSNWQEILGERISQPPQKNLAKEFIKLGKLNFYLKGKTFSGFMLPPNGVFSKKINLKGKFFLDFGFGLLRDEKVLSLKNLKGVLFSVLIKTKDSPTPKLLYSQVVSPPELPMDRMIYFHRVNLIPYQGQKITLILETRMEGKALKQDEKAIIPAIWINPLLYRLRESRKSQLINRPNIILLSIDTLRADHLSCYDYSRETSPNIDSLAAEGIIFTRAFSPAPYTLSSHMSLLTGLYPLRHQVLYLDQSLDPEIKTIASRLRQVGYVCGAFTDGGQVSHRFGFSQGFDFFEEEVSAEAAPKAAEKIFIRSAGWLKRHRDTTFFLFLHTYQPHNPYHAPEPWGTMFLEENHSLSEARLQDLLGDGYPHLFQPFPEDVRQNLIALYDGEIRFTDEKLIRPLIKLLKELGIYDKSVIIVTSDHGEEFFDHSSWAHGHQLYNEILHVPLILKFPSFSLKKRKITAPVRLIDVVPTILELAGVKYKPSEIDGQSLLTSLSLPPSKVFTSIAYLPQNFAAFLPRSIALFRGDMKFIWHDQLSAEAFKFFDPPPPQVAIELFDLNEDEAEQNNIYERNPKISREFLQEVERILVEAKKIEVKGRTEEAMDEGLRRRLRALGYIAK